MDPVTYSTRELAGRIQNGEQYTLFAPITRNRMTLIGTGKILTARDVERIERIDLSTVQVVPYREPVKEEKECNKLLADILDFLSGQERYARLVPFKKTKVLGVFEHILPDQPYVFAKLEAMRTHEVSLFEHSLHVAFLSLVCNLGLQVRTGKGMIDAMQFEDILLGSLLHDLGLLQTPSDLLKKKRIELEPPERETFARHPIVGANMLGIDRGGHALREAAIHIVREHEERGDGSGPLKLPADAISPHARLVGLCDAFDLLLSGHMSLAPRPMPQIAAKLRSAPGQFDRRLVNTLLEEFRYLA